MALNGATIWQIQTGGSDTANGGAFDPSVTAGMNTDGAATVANTSAPVFTSASYNFVSGDVGAWLYIASGTNWRAGWYNIASVASNAATLSAAIGAATLSNYALSAALGCASVASPTTATWTIDYSQQASPQFSYTDLTDAGTGLTSSSAAHPFGKQQVGNCLVITGGTLYNTGRYVIASVSGTTATFVGPTNITTGVGSGGTGGLGGALASPGQAGAVRVAGNDAFYQGGTYTINSATANIAGGCLSLPTSASNSNITKDIGYTSVRGDGGVTAIFKASGISTFTLITCSTSQGNHIENIILDGNSLTSSTSMTGTTAQNRAYRCTAKNCTTAGFNAVQECILCLGTTNSGTAFNGCGGFGNVGYANTATPFVGVSGNPYVACAAINNTGASTDGFNPIGGGSLINCLSYGNGRNDFNATASNRQITLINCYGEGLFGYRFTASAATDNILLINCGGFNNGGAGVVNATNITSATPGFQTLTSTAFNNAGGLDFSLNNVATGGGLLRAAGIPGAISSNQLPGLSTLSYGDIGLAQHFTQTLGGSVTVANGLATLSF